MTDNIPYGYCQCGCGQQTSIPSKSCASRGIVRGVPQRYIRGHNTRLGLDRYTVLDCGHSTPCWIWLGTCNDGGYGTVHHQGKRQYVHRVFYERAVGLIPIELQIDHRCRQRSCVNPDHLEPTTTAINTRRGNATAFFDKDIKTIRALWESGTYTQTRLATLFGVGQPAISRIVNKKRWG